MLSTVRARPAHVSPFSIIAITKASDSTDVAFSNICTLLANKSWRKHSCLFYAVPTRITRVISELRTICSGRTHRLGLTPRRVIIKNLKATSRRYRALAVTLVRDNSNKIFKRQHAFCDEAFSFLSTLRFRFFTALTLPRSSFFYAIFARTLYFFVKKCAPLFAARHSYLTHLNARALNSVRSRFLIQNNWNLL